VEKAKIIVLKSGKRPEVIVCANMAFYLIVFISFIFLA